jgi:hypothetical protein
MVLGPDGMPVNPLQFLKPGLSPASAGALPGGGDHLQAPLRCDWTKVHYRGHAVSFTLSLACTPAFGLTPLASRPG